MNTDEFILPKEVEPIKETLELWKGKYNYFHKYEDALYELAVDRKCRKCGKPTGTTYHLLCLDCRKKKKDEEYNNMPYKEWDGETPLCLFDDSETYFFSEEEIVDYSVETGKKLSEIQLVIAEPVKTPTFDIEDFLYREIEAEPEYREQILSDSKVEIINTFVNNILLKELDSELNLWVPGEYRTSFWIEGE